jgi:hypothetical protein
MAVNVERTRGVATGRALGAERLSTETKQAFKTTEFWAMVALIAGILVASYVIGDDDTRGDGFPAVRAWLYVTIVGAAYMVSRGLAKAGSREPYRAGRDDLPGGRDDDR